MKWFFVFIFLLVSCTQDEKTLVLVNGRPITETELLKASGGVAHFTSDLEKREFLKNKLEQMVDKYVLEYEAGRLKMSEEELFKFFEEIKTKEMNAEDIKKLVDSKLTPQEISQNSKDQIVELLKNKLFDEAKKKYVSELKQRSTIRYKESL